MFCRFNRFQKPYEPSPDAAPRFLNLVKSLNPKFSKLSEKELKEIKLDDPLLKYEILTKASKEFQHSVPNSMLIVIRTIGTLISRVSILFKLYILYYIISIFTSSTTRNEN